ncbi:aquaporin [Streptomyces sp. NPDC003710]
MILPGHGTVTVSLWLTGAFPCAASFPTWEPKWRGRVLGAWCGGLRSASRRSATRRSCPRPPAAHIGLSRRGWRHDGHHADGRFLHGSCPLCAPGSVVIGLSVALVIAFPRPCSGGLINPARQFGPAAFAGQTTDLRICLVAPILGAALGARLHHLLSSRRVTREVRVRTSGESPDGRVAAVGVSRWPIGCTQAPTGIRRSTSDGQRPPPQPPSRAV